MSDHTPTPDDALDELVSAVLDGEADPDERARVEADPDLRRRLEELRSVRDLVAEPVTGLDDLTARRLRDRALDAAGRSASTVRPARASSPRSAWLDPRLLGAAAVLLLLVLAVPVALSLGDADRGDDAASAGFDEAGESAEVLRDAESMDDADGGADASSGAAVEHHESGPADVVDLGAADTDDDLAARAEAFVEGSSTNADSVDPNQALYGSLGSLEGACLSDEPGEVVATFTGRTGGAERIVSVLDDEGTTRIVVRDATTCEVVAQRP